MSEIVEIALFTDDVEAAKAFYGDLLTAEPEAEWPGGAIFAAGSAKLLVHERAGALAGRAAQRGSLRARRTRLWTTPVASSRGAAVAFLVEPRDYPWGRSAYLRDPDGRLVELSQT